MFNLFKKKSPIESLQKEYAKLMESWHDLSKINRAESDKKYMEAQEVLKKIEERQKK